MTDTNSFFTYRLILKLYKWFVTTYKREGAFRSVPTVIITVLRAKMDRMNRRDIHVPLS